VDGTKGVEDPDSERKLLQVIAKQNAQLAARIAGSQSKLQSILSGADFTAVQNAARDAVHEIKQTGITRSPSLPLQF
jgi:ethanolamine ammonia-lyase small subunit